MRLINTTTMKLEVFMGDQVPSYAILSHTWGEGEVTFQDFSHLEAAALEKGFVKIEHSCRQARQNGIDYVWVDTCCTIQSHHR
jgi:Heterokaryon incompatibility protein (HET)